MGIANSQIRNAVNEWVQGERDRYIMIRNMVDGRGYEYIAEELDISSRTVANTVRKWKPIIRTHL